MDKLCIKAGCFLTGYNYNIVRNSSEATVGAVKKYLSSLIIIAIVWGFIGYAFTERYLHGDIVASIIGAALMMFIIIQIERQIILSTGKNKAAFIFRVIIGIIMALIGSVILDQKIFKDDIEKSKIEGVQQEVERILPIKTQELDQQIQQYNQAIIANENERAQLMNELTKHPTISTSATSTCMQKDPDKNRLIPVAKTITSQSIPNPKAEMISELNEQIKVMREQKANKEKQVLNARRQIEKEISDKRGFLDELKIMLSILLSSGAALSIWLLFFLFFMAIELFVLMNKLGDEVNDYGQTVIHQRNIRMKMLEQLSNVPQDKNLSSTK